MSTDRREAAHAAFFGALIYLPVLCNSMFITYE